MTFATPVSDYYVCSRCGCPIDPAPFGWATKTNSTTFRWCACLVYVPQTTKPQGG